MPVNRASYHEWLQQQTFRIGPTAKIGALRIRPPTVATSSQRKDAVLSCQVTPRLDA